MRVGSFKVRGLLGEGAFGRTYVGDHAVLGFPVCIKEEKTGQEPYVTMFREEATLLAKVRHFGLPTLLDYMEDVPGCGNLMVMTHIAGVPLGKDVEKNGPLTDEHLFWVVDRILAPIGYLHAKWNMVHCDLKPDNVIVDYPIHEATVVDLGMATLKPDELTTAKGGTPGYLPPEFELGYPPLPASDVYSVGKILIFLATGSDELVQRSECPADMDPRLRNLIGKMIQRDPRRRPDDADGLRDEFHELRHRLFGRTTCDEMVERRKR